MLAHAPALQRVVSRFAACNANVPTPQPATLVTVFFAANQKIRCRVGENLTRSNRNAKVNSAMTRPQPVFRDTAITTCEFGRRACIDEILTEMYLCGVPVQRLRHFAEALADTRISSEAVTRLNRNVYKHLQRWRRRELPAEQPYVYLGTTILNRPWANEARNIPILAAVGLRPDDRPLLLAGNEAFTAFG